jgi:hypothetical protein
VVVTLAIAGVTSVTIFSSLPDAAGGAGPASAESPKEIRLDFTRTQAVLLASGYGVHLDLKFDKNCAANSYGLVHRFFLANPCRWLARASLTLRESGHAAILVALSWVGMPSHALADRYMHLVGKFPTGNITELTRVSGPYRGIRYSGKFYASGINGAAVWNAEVQPTGRLPVTIARKILSDSRQVGLGR